MPLPRRTRSATSQRSSTCLLSGAPSPRVRTSHEEHDDEHVVVGRRVSNRYSRFGTTRDGPFQTPSGMPTGRPGANETRPYEVVVSRGHRFCEGRAGRPWTWMDGTRREVCTNWRGVSAETARACAKHRHTVVWRCMSCGRTTKHICMRPWKGSLDETIVDFACSEQGWEEEQIGRTRSADKKCEVDVLATSTFVACPALARRVTTNGSRNGLIYPPICWKCRRRWTKQAESCCEATLFSC